MTDFTSKSLCVWAGAILFGCGAESMTEAEAQAAAEEIVNNGCVDAQTLCVELSIPEDYSGQPRALATALYDSTNTYRPPDETLPEIESPTIVAGEVYKMAHTNVEIEGDYYAMFVLYDEDGGMWAPEAGKDYTVMTDEMISFEGTAVDLGTLDMKVAED